MSKTQIVKVRLSSEIVRKIERVSKNSGISFDETVNYFVIKGYNPIQKIS